MDPIRIASKTIGGLFNGATTRELDLLSIQTAASLIAEEPEYSKLAARLLNGFIDKEVANQDIHSFSQSVGTGKQHGLVSKTWPPSSQPIRESLTMRSTTTVRSFSSILGCARCMTAISAQSGNTRSP